MEAPLLCQRPSSLTSMAWPQEKSLGPRPEPSSYQTSLNQSYTTLRNASNQYKSFLINKEILPGVTQASDTKPSGACYSYTTYSWMARSSRFMDPTTLLDYSHILNVVTALYQRGHEWRWISLHGDHTIKQRDLRGYKKLITCESCSYADLKYPHPRRQLRRI